MKKISIFILISLYSNLLHSQIDTINVEMQDSADVKLSFKPFIIPAVLISYGIAAKISKPLQKWEHSIANKTTKQRIKADDYMQYASYVAVYGMDIAGIKAKHNLQDRTFIVAASNIITTLIVQTSKRTTLIVRPDGSDSYSFPSGHTAAAFAGAHILFKEYKNASPWIGVAGYGVALATGSMRILNNKHWLSDVIAGAGTGILSVELSYLLLPAWNKLLGWERKNRSFAVFPVINREQAVLSLSYRF